MAPGLTRWLRAVALFSVLGATATPHSQLASVNLSRDLVALGIAAQNLAPNNPALDARPLFEAAVQYVRNHHVPLLTVDPGTYYFLTPQSPDGYTNLYALSDLTFDFAGSMIYFQEAYRNGFVFGDAQRVTFKNARIDYIVPPYTHAQVTSVDAAGQRIFYAALPGWADPITLNGANAPAGYGVPEYWAMVFRNGEIVPGTSRMWVNSPLPGGRIDLRQNWPPSQPATLSTILPGDTLVVMARAGPSPLSVYRGDAIVLSNITFYGSAGWAAVIEQVSNSTVDGLRVMPRPGVGLIGSDGDGIHLSWARQNNRVRNCYVARTLDDGIAIDSIGIGTILRKDGPRQLHVKRFGGLRFPNGTALNFVDAATTGEISGGIVVSQSPPDTLFPPGYDEVDLTFDRDLPTVPIGGEIVYASPDLRGNGAVIEDNVVDDIMGRGIWVSGIIGATLRRNRVGHTAQAGIAITQDTLAFPGPPSRDLLIDSNTVVGSLGPMGQMTGATTALAAIEVSTTDNNSFTLSQNAVNSNITIRNNFIADSGRSGIWIGELYGGLVQDNVVVRWNQRPTAVIWGMNSRNATIVGADFSLPSAVHFSNFVTFVNNVTQSSSDLTGPVTLGASTAALPGSAGSGGITVQAVVPGFSWRAQSDADWLTPNPSVGTGTATLAFAATANRTGAARTALVTVAGRTLTVTQDPLKPLTLDFDRDEHGDFGVYRPSTGEWFVRRSSAGYAVAGHLNLQWGLVGDLPVAGDYDGDRQIDAAVYRPTTGEWFFRYSSQGYSLSAYAVYQWGLPGDVPIVGDFDGDGRADLTVYRPTTGEWYIRYSSQSYSTGTYGLYQWGLPGDQPLVADFDSDGKTEFTVYRPTTGEWFIRYSSQNYSIGAFGLYQWGLAGDRPIVADFDGDGRAELTVYRPTTGEWYIRFSRQNYNPGMGGWYQWGLAGDVPMILDVDGDGRSDLTVYRPTTGEWFVRRSTQGYSVAAYGLYQWGLAGDTPLPDR